MRTILFLIQKEFLQIFRDKAMLFIILAVPVVQLLILSNAATFELKESNFHLVDFDKSESSRELVSSFTSSDIFRQIGSSEDIDSGIDNILRNSADMVVVIPRDFEKELLSGESPKVQLVISAVDGNTAGLTQSYSQQVLGKFNRGIASEVTFANRRGHPVKMANIIPSHSFNPELNYITYMVPGILVVLVTLIGLLLTVLNLVREKEIGTAEQINVTPIKKYQFLSGKLIPLWCLALVELTLGLLIAKFVFDVPFRGNVAVIYGSAMIYLFAVQGIGLFISTITNTQQQGMYIVFFLFMIFMLLGGIFTPIESMPLWAQKTTYINPISQFGVIIRSVLLKGSAWVDLLQQVGVLSVMVMVTLTASVLNYSKRVG